MEEWIIRALFTVAGAATYKLGEIIVKRLYIKSTMSQEEFRDALVELIKKEMQQETPQETPQEVETIE